eukprot:gene4166-20352_t
MAFKKKILIFLIAVVIASNAAGDLTSSEKTAITAGFTTGEKIAETIAKRALFRTSRDYCKTLDAIRQHLKMKNLWKYVVSLTVRKNYGGFAVGKTSDLKIVNKKYTIRYKVNRRKTRSFPAYIVDIIYTLGCKLQTDVTETIMLLAPSGLLAEGKFQAAIDVVAIDVDQEPRNALTTMGGVIVKEAFTAITVETETVFGDTGRGDVAETNTTALVEGSVFLLTKDAIMITIVETSKMSGIAMSAVFGDIPDSMATEEGG